MPVISDTRLGARLTFAPLPPLATPEACLADALPLLDPPSRISVTDAAEAHVRVEVHGDWQRFDRSVTPYMVEPADAARSRRYRSGVFVGPSQSGKTKALENIVAHAVMCDQRPVMIIHMTQHDRNKWVEDKLDRTIANSPDLNDRLGKGSDDSTYSRKRFKGMRLNIGYPTKTVLSGGTYGMVVLTDYDHMPQVLGGKDNPEGSPYRMALQRTKTFLSRGWVFAESTPSYPVTDASWRPSADAPHMLPPVESGVAQLYNDGTRGRFYWECPDCHEEFEPRFDRLVYDAELTPGAAGKSAEMACPHCGSLIAHRHKMELNRGCLKDRGGWRHEGADGVLTGLYDGDVRDTSMASWALNGAAATFASWAEIVEKYEDARRKFAQLDDENDLRTVMYTDIGVPYQKIRSDDDTEIDVQYLRDHAHDTPRGVAPGWARFLVVSADVQGSYFAVQITAFGEDGQKQVVDRFDLTTPPEDAPKAERDVEGNSRRLDPGKYAEDWAVLEPLGQRVWPVQGEDWGLQALALVVDFQGEPGVSDNAERFLKARRAEGQGQLWFVYRGNGGFRQGRRVWYAAPESRSGGGKGRSIKILNLATDRIKDTIFAAMARGGTAKGGLLVPQWMDDSALEEFVAEERGDKRWEKKPGKVRNEGFDLSCVAQAVAEHKGLLRINWSAPPAWAVGGLENPNAVRREDADAKAAETPRAPVRRVPSRLF